MRSGYPDMSTISALLDTSDDSGDPRTTVGSERPERRPTHADTDESVRRFEQLIVPELPFLARVARSLSRSHATPRTSRKKRS